MAASEVEIVNAALSRIGHTDLLEDTVPLLDDLEDGTENVALEQARLHYPKVRDLVLRRFPWPFATLRERLFHLPAEKRSDWEFAYPIPTDSLALREVLVEGIRNPRPDQRPPHRIEARRGEPDTRGMRPVIGQLVLSDQEALEVRHTVRVENPAVFPVDFEEALVARLAAALAPPIVKGKEGSRLSRECLEEHESYIRLAWATARGEENLEQDPDCSFIASRR